jgi:hypothetical protein
MYMCVIYRECADLCRESSALCTFGQSRSRIAFYSMRILRICVHVYVVTRGIKTAKWKCFVFFRVHFWITKK